MRHLPLFFDTQAAKILLVGNGKGAIQRLRHLQATSADIIVLVGFAEGAPLRALRRMAEAHDRTVLEYRDFQPSYVNGDVNGDLDAKLIFLAPETATERKRAEEIAAIARAHKIPVNAIDDKALCDFYMPSMVKREPLVVAIGSEGAAPLLARNIKSEIEKLLPQNLGALAEGAGKLRELVKARVPHALRRQFWQKFFDSPTADKVARGVLPASRLKQLAEFLANDTEKPTARLDVIAAENNIASLKSQARLALLQADVVIYDSDTSEAVLNLVRRDADFIATDSGSFAPQIAAEYAAKSLRVVRLLRKPRAASAEANRFKRLLPQTEIAFHDVTYQPTEKAA